MIDNTQIDPTKPLVFEAEKQGNNRNSSWFKPGQSGNPNGRPHKEYSITEAFRKMLGANPETKKLLVDRILKSALDGDMAAAKMIWQYMDGMPKQAMDLTTQGTEVPTIILDTKPKI